MADDPAIQLTDRPRARPSEGELGFGRFFSDHMVLLDYAAGRGWHDARIVPYGPLPLDPAAAVLHYGQAIFEGMKAFRGADDRIRLFRPDRHADRLNASARRLCIPELPPERLLALASALVRVEENWVPSSPGTALYLRPAIIATEPFLGVRTAERYLLFVIASPVGGYYGAAGLTPLKLWVERRHVRAAPGGLGAAKTAANYAASLATAAEAKGRGYSQVLWLDAAEHRYLEEAGTMNVFVRFADTLVTPPLDGTILPGVTRDCVLTLAREWGLKVQERRIGIEEVLAAHADGLLSEVFGTGTAAVIAPVGELGTSERRLTIGGGGVGELSRRLYQEIVALQAAQLRDRHGWLRPVAD